MLPPGETYLRPLYDRGREKAELDRAFGSGKPELIIATGRRRAGKSFLLTHYLRDKRGLYYQATKGTSREQLRTLTQIASARSSQSGLQFTGGFADWDAFFRYVIQEAAGQPFFLVLDEFSYLLESIRGFGSLLQRVWDHALAESQVKLVLSGSYVSAMKRLTAADQPLHGRKTGTLRFSQFSYLDAACFFPEYSSRDRLVAFAAFGGLPGHLALIDPAGTVAENVARQLLDPGGRLAEEAEHLFDSFLRDAGVHYSIVRAIASGEQKWSRITSRVGKGGASLSRPLDWLQDMDVITRIIPVTVQPPGPAKRAMYRVTDQYLRFWHRFVAIIRATGADDLAEPAALWQQFLEPELDNYMGAVLEDACRYFVGHVRHPRLPFHPVRVGEWWTEDSSEQIDVVCLGESGQLLLGECKWGAFGRDDLHALERRRDLILKELNGIKQVHLAAFVGRQLTDRAVADRVANGDLILFTLDDLYP
jgi:AAA+ ATPase superfamily predicted ATPase